MEFMIENSWIPFKFRSKEDMGEGIKLMVRMWTDVETRKPIFDGKRYDIPIKSYNALESTGYMD